MKKQMPPSKNARPRSEKSGRRFSRIGASTSQIVLDAAALLDEEVAAGIVAARRIQDRFQKERRFEPGDLDEVLQRFRSNAHDIVNTLNDQFTSLRSSDNDELIGRFLKNTHDLLDLAFGMVTTGAEIVSKFAQSKLNRPNQPSAGAKAHGRRRR